jgi:hypothetical protein
VRGRWEARLQLRLVLEAQLAHQQVHDAQLEKAAPNR